MSLHGDGRKRNVSYQDVQGLAVERWEINEEDYVLFLYFSVINHEIIVEYVAYERSGFNDVSWGNIKKEIKNNCY